MFNGQDTRALWDPPTKLQLWVGAGEGFSGTRGVGSEEEGPFVSWCAPQGLATGEEIGVSGPLNPTLLTLLWDQSFNFQTAGREHTIFHPHGEEASWGIAERSY